MTTTQSDRPDGVVEEVQQKGEELVSQAQERAHEMRGEAGVRLRDQVDERSTQAGEQVRAVGKALRRSSEQLRTEGKGAPASVVEQVARRADDLGGYLQQANADRILGDVEDFARRRPWLTGAIAATAGFLASRVVKASSARRYETSAHGGRPRAASTQGLPAGGR
jgi:ElaB/YqjD/DUF883 family membrane-anchored ribosome-binding protein